MFTVYVLYSQKYDKIYIGATSDLENRFLSHNELDTKGYTIKFPSSQFDKYTFSIQWVHQQPDK